MTRRLGLILGLALTALALGIGAIGAAVIEALWWAQAAWLGDRPKLWGTGGSAHNGPAIGSGVERTD